MKCFLFQRSEKHPKDCVKLRFVSVEASLENKNEQLILLVLINLTGGDYNSRRYSNRLNSDLVYLLKHIFACLCTKTKGVKYLVTSWKRDAFEKYMALNWSISLLQTSSNMCNLGEVCMMVKSLKEGSLTVLRKWKNCFPGSLIIYDCISCNTLSFKLKHLHFTTDRTY